jgi:outer membrane receptor protein involved in Fe transport
VTSFGLSAGANVVAQSSQYYRGDEANLLPPIPGYAVVNARASYRVAPPVTVWVLVDNVFDARFSTFGVLGDPTPVFPGFTDPRFLGPGAPRAAWVGLDIHH